jgi:hypothetical protein
MPTAVGERLAEAGGALAAGRIADAHRSGLVDEHHHLHREAVGVRGIGAHAAAHRQVIVERVDLRGLLLQRGAATGRQHHGEHEARRGEKQGGFRVHVRRFDRVA